MTKASGAPVSAALPASDLGCWGAFLTAAGCESLPGESSGDPRSRAHGKRPRGVGARQTYQLIYVTRGRGRLDCYPGGSHPLRKGDLAIVFPGRRHRCVADASTGWDRCWVEAGGDFIRRLMGHPVFAGREPIHAVGCERPLRALFLRARDALQGREAGFQFVAGALGVEILAQVLAALKQQDLAGAPLDRVVVEACELLIRPEFSEMRMERFAAQFGLAYSTFRRRFKEQTGFSPRQYALESSIARAREMIERTRLPVHRVARQLGFNTVAYFSRLFKKKTGLTPSDLRRHGVPSAGFRPGGAEVETAEAA